MKLRFELTDTFSGEANYSWVRRGEKLLERYNDLTERRIILEAKRWAGWSGIFCNKEYHGETLVLRPRGLCQILFIDQEV